MPPNATDLLEKILQKLDQLATQTTENKTLLVALTDANLVDRLARAETQIAELSKRPGESRQSITTVVSITALLADLAFHVFKH